MFSLEYPYNPAPVLPRPTALAPGKKRFSGSEMLPVIDENGIVTAQATRAYCHSGSRLLHPVVHLHIIDRFSRIFLQKRSMTKDLCPGMWDTAVGGHVTYGEGVEEALYREASEELGLTAFNPIYLGTDLYETERDREFVVIYAAVGNFTLSPSNAEVSEGRWWTLDEIDSNLGKSVFTPNFEGEFVKIRKTLESLL